MPARYVTPQEELQEGVLKISGAWGLFLQIALVICHSWHCLSEQEMHICEIRERVKWGS